MVSRDIYARDVRRAKEYLTERVQHYATLILDPILGEDDYILHVMFEPMSIHDEAESVYYDDEKVLDVFFSEELVEANIYNIKSKHFDGLIIHEMCHLKEYLSGNFGQHHGAASYRKCVIDAGADKTWVSSRTHAHKYSIRHYMGSENGIVPVDILHIWGYYCPREQEKFVENTTVTKRKDISSCNNCGERVNPVHIPPLTVHTYFTDKDIDLH